jgi:amino acid transporter
VRSGLISLLRRRYREEAVGKAAPWFILGVMLFSFAVRAVYVESCSMFTRGGVYRVVKEALGGTFAKLSVSALMFDYILTGPDLRRIRRTIHHRPAQ